MIPQDTESEILKVDTKGRIRTTPERRAELLDEFEKSGLSAPKFAQLVGVKYQTFIIWVQQRRKQKGLSQAGQPNQPVQWFETVVPPAALGTSSALVIRFSSGAQMEVKSAEQAALAAALLRAWEKLPC